MVVVILWASKHLLLPVDQGSLAHDSSTAAQQHTQTSLWCDLHVQLLQEYLEHGIEKRMTAFAHPYDITHTCSAYICGSSVNRHARHECCDKQEKL